MIAEKIPQKILARQHEITTDFLKEVDIHLADIVNGKTDVMLEIRDLAALMHIHPTHLSNTIKLVTGNSPCYYYEGKIMDIARKMLTETDMPVAEIARLLTYDPSNFTKFFKHFQHTTPLRYRQQMLQAQYAVA